MTATEEIVMIAAAAYSNTLSRKFT